MSQMSHQPVIQVKPEPNVYTVLILVAIVALLVALVVVSHNLMSSYGLSFGEMFGKVVTPSAVPFSPK